MMKYFIGAGTAVLVAGCANGVLPGGEPPEITSFVVQNVDVWDSDLAPDWAAKPPRANFKFFSAITFNDPVNPQTLVSGVTVDYRLNDARADGTFQISPDGRTAVFFSDEEMSEITPLLAGRNTEVSLVVRGRSGPIFDSDGAQLPFSGVHRDPSLDDASPIASDLNFGVLLDGDADGAPGGDYVETWTIVG